MPSDEITDRHRRAAEAHDAVFPAGPLDTDALAANPAFRAAVDAVLTAERERIVQAARGLTAGDPVTADEVADVVWGEHRD